MATKKTADAPAPSHRRVKSHDADAEMSESGLHPEKLTYARFSDMRKSLDEDRMTIGRLLLYVAIVVAIGVGLTIGIQAYIRYQNEQQAIANNNVIVSGPTSASILINNDIKADNLAQPNGLSDDKYSNTAGAIGTDVVASSPVNALTNFGFDRYTTFERITLAYNGSSVKDPKTEVTYNSTDNIIYLQLKNIGTDKKDLKPGMEIAKLTDTNTVKSVQNSSTDATTTRISIYLNEAAKFTLRDVGSSLVLDIRQADYVAASSSSSASSSSTSSAGASSSASSSADAAAPAAPYYDNAYSKNTQFISSSYTGNKLRVWNYTYRDYGDRYEFKFRIKDDGSGVSPMIPKAKAYLNGSTTDPKLIVEIRNINWEILDRSNNADCFDAVAYGNVKKICGEFRADKNMVTYEISLYKLADFEMDTIENSTVDATRAGQVVWLKIKDN
jgi:hypothetical protein